MKTARVCCVEDGFVMAGKRTVKTRARADADRPCARVVRPAAPVESPLADFDTQLMLQVQEGNRDAASSLIRRNRERIARYVARLVSDRRAVEDLTQDVFLQALTHAEKYQPTAKVVTWLYRIATNVSLNYLKQPAVRRRAPEPPEGYLEVADRNEATPERRLGLDELQQRVSEAILSLPINQRIALTLLQYEGCSYEQISAVLGVTVEAVRSLLMRARRALREQLRGLA